MTEADHKKITGGGVTQIGRLVGQCAKHNMTVSDIMIMMQTATSLVCEMNDIDIAEYMKFLYILHRRRTTAVEDAPSDHIINAELAAIFNLNDKQTDEEIFEK